MKSRAAILFASALRDRNQTPAERVRQRFPNAFSERNGLAFQVVDPRGYGNVAVLGSGISLARAWMDAAKMNEC